MYRQLATVFVIGNGNALEYCMYIDLRNGLFYFTSVLPARTRDELVKFWHIRHHPSKTRALPSEWISTVCTIGLHYRIT